MTTCFDLLLRRGYQECDFILSLYYVYVFIKYLL